MRWSLVSIGWCGSLALSALLAAAELRPNVDAAVRDLKSSDPAAQVAAADRLGEAASQADQAVPALVEALGSSNEQLRWHAERALGAIGPAAAAATDALIKGLDDKDALVRAYAAFALGRIKSDNPAVLPKLAQAVEDSDLEVRRMAVRAIVDIRPGKEKLLPVLVAQLKKSEPSVLMPALGAIAEAGSAAVPLMIEALKEPTARFWACVVLADIGPGASDAVPALVGVLTDSDVGVRREALLALGAIGPMASAAVPAMIQALDDPADSVGPAAAFALGHLGTDAKSASPALRGHLNDEDPLLRVVSVWALTHIEPGDEQLRAQAVSMLLEALQHKNAGVRSAAIRALADLKSGDAAVLPAFIAAMNDSDPGVSGVAIDVLSGLGQPAVGPLMEALRAPVTRGMAALALARIGPPAEPAVADLVRALADASPDVRHDVLLALASIGPSAGSSAEDLKRILADDSDKSVRRAAAYAIGRIGPNAQAAVPGLRAALSGKDLDLAVTSGWALARIAPQDDEIARQALPILIAGLKSSEISTRIHAAEALGALGSRASEARAALRDALDDNSERVRGAVSRALESVEK